MEQEMLQIGDLKLHPGTIQRKDYHGVHSGKTLSLLELLITTRNVEQKHKIEQLLAMEKVSVIDPLQNRSFAATLQLQSSSFSDRDPERHYVIELKEIDEPPSFDVLEIQGEPFAVSEYRETLELDDQVGRHAVLRLDRSDLGRLRSLIKGGGIPVKRVGVDAAPLTLRFGGMLHWSEHDEDGERFYKQIVRFYPTELGGPKIIFSSPVVSGNTSDLAIEIAEKFNLLLEALKADGSVTEALSSRLRISPDSSHIDPDIARKWEWRLEQVEDASAHL